MKPHLTPASNIERLKNAPPGTSGRDVILGQVKHHFSVAWEHANAKHPFLDEPDRRTGMDFRVGRRRK